MKIFGTLKNFWKTQNFFQVDVIKMKCQTIASMVYWLALLSCTFLVLGSLPCHILYTRAVFSSLPPHRERMKAGVSHHSENTGVSVCRFEILFPLFFCQFTMYFFCLFCSHCFITSSTVVRTDRRYMLEISLKCNLGNPLLASVLNPEIWTWL